jgi:hypothetical protein
MSHPLTKRIAIAILGAAIAGYFVLCFPSRRVEIYRDQFVRAGDLVSPISLIAPHVDRPHYLSVFGETYRGVQGLKPFYLEVPALNSILFVTGDDDQTFHLVNLKTKKHLRVNASKTGFGGHISSVRQTGEAYTDFVERVTTNFVTVATQYPEAKKSFFLDFNAGRLDRIVYEEYKDHATNRSVYVDGRRVN